MYVDEEIARTKDAYEEDQLRQRLKGLFCCATSLTLHPLIYVSAEQEALWLLQAG